MIGWGVEDKYLRQGEAEALQACNPEVITFKTIQGAGHQVQEDYAERVVGTIRGILEA